MAVIYDSKGLSINRGNPNSGQTGMKQIGRTFTWSGSSQYQTLIQFTRSGTDLFKFQIMLWYMCSVRDNGEGRAGGYIMNDIYARYVAPSSSANINCDEFTGDRYPSGGDIAMPIQSVASTGNNIAYIRFELYSGWSPVIVTMGGYITCNRWDLLTISYP